MKISFRAVLIFLVLLVAAGGAISFNSNAPATTSRNYSSGACVDDGVTLVIDFGKSGPTSEVRCALQFSGSSWQLFEAVGLQVQGTLQYPQSFVCRIEGWPKNQSCKSTPNPQSGYWKYFIATGGQHVWKYSPIGAASRKPDCGDFEGWLFVSSEDGPEAERAAPRVEPNTFQCEN